MKTPLLLAIGAALLSCMIAPSLAQQELKVRAISFQPGFPVELHAHLPDGSATAGLVEIKTFLNDETNLLKYKGGPLVFTARSNPVSATDVNQVIGRVEIPEGVKSCILLFLPEKAEPGNLHSRVMAIDDSQPAFPAGSFKIANFASVQVKIELEKETFEFASGEIRVIAKPPFGENKAASMEAYLKHEDKWQLVSSGSWPNPGTRRVLQIVIENPETHQLELKGVRDVVVP
ncbi:MAG: hypothetical protein ABIT37_21315 [Luteolibacter sp.]